MSFGVNKTLHTYFHSQKVVINSTEKEMHLGKVPYFPSYLLMMFRIYLTGLHQCLKGRQSGFCESNRFSRYILWWTFVCSFFFDDDRIKLCTSQKNQILRNTLQGAHDSGLNACWQTSLFVETWLLCYTGDGWNVLVHLPHCQEKDICKASEVYLLEKRRI